MTNKDTLDPKGLITDAYAIDGITAPECRSIFLDWALSYQGKATAGIAGLLERHADKPTDHPMTATLRDGLAPSLTPRRRGGRRARVEEQN